MGNVSTEAADPDAIHAISTMMDSLQRVHDQIQEVAHAMVTTFQETANEAVAGFQQTMEGADRQFANAMAGYEQYINEEEAKVFEALKQGGWIGLERYFSLTRARAALEMYNTAGEAAMNESISKYFNNNKGAHLARMADRWLGVPYLRDRMEIISQALDAHRTGQYALTIPALLPVAEGLCTEIIGSARVNAVQRMAQHWHTTENGVWVELFRAIVHDVIYSWYRPGTGPAPYLNRHAIVHGWVTGYWSEANSTRVFLLVDAIANRWLETKRTLIAATAAHSGT
jgi:hypothetical protein